MRHLMANRNFWIMLIGDALLVVLAYYLSYLIRFDGVVPPDFMDRFAHSVVWIVPIYLMTFYFSSLYKGMWRYTSLQDLVNMVQACFIASTIVIFIILGVYRFQGYSRSIFILNGLLCLLLVGGYRVLIRLFYARPAKGRGIFKATPGTAKIVRLLIIGAGSSAEKLIREIRENRLLNYDLIGLLDDEPTKYKQTLHGIPVLGDLARLPELVKAEKIDEVIIAVPSATGRQLRRMVEACKAAGVDYKTVPGMGELIQGTVSVSSIRQVRYEDLLNREPVALDSHQIGAYLKGKSAMVTGGAGSIGTELCRQIAPFTPRQLIIVDRNESGLYDHVLDLCGLFPEIEIIPVLASVQHRDRMEAVFREYRPEVLFHAAAYKHVPMIEAHPWEAIYSNVVGTLTILAMCHQFQTARCVVVSTDKAVRATSVMGATKRLVELLTQSYAAHSKVRFMAVRFGNVLGSAGSVLPLFQKQISAGGPITVTDSRMTRYFMTIPEACGLILQSGALGRGGEIFILKMGTPVRIVEMARDLISLSGFEPGEDIQIKIIGLRPGEKLFEELITEGEGIGTTGHEDIMVLKSERCADLATMQNQVDRLAALAKHGDGEGIRNLLKEIIHDFCPESICPETIDGCVPSEINPFIQPTKDAEQIWRGEPIAANGGAAAVGAGNFVSKEFPGRVDQLMLDLLADRGETVAGFQLDSLSSTDWEKIIGRANRHFLSPLLYIRLKQSGRIAVLPVNTAEQLRQIYLANTKRAMIAYHWIGKFLQLLKTNQIPVIVLKGAYLAEAVYEDIAVRPFADVDLLFKPTDLDRAQQVLLGGGFIGPQSPLNLDIHWAIDLSIADLAIDMDAIWARATPVTIAGVTVHTLSPTDELIHICVHLAFHHQFKFGGVRALADVRETIRNTRPHFKWAALVERAGRYGVANTVLLTLHLAHTLLDVPLPASVLAQIQGLGQVLTVGESWALGNIFNDAHEEGFLSPYFWEIWRPGSLWRRLKAVKRVIWPPREFIVQKYPVSHKSYRSLFFYFRRVKEKIGYYVPALLRILVREKRMLQLIEQERQNIAMREWLAGRDKLEGSLRATGRTNT